jgi:hypothetical protein
VKQVLLTACLPGTICLLSFGLAGPPEQDDVPPPKVSIKAEKAKTMAPGKSAPKVESMKAAAGKAGGKQPSKTPVADLLKAAGDLLGNAAEGVFGAPRQERAVPAVRVAPQAPQAFVVQIEQQYAPRVRQLYKSELHLMRLVCQPTREQFEKIREAVDANSKADIKKYVAAVAEQRQGRFVGNAGRVDARHQVASSIAGAVKTVLSPEQVARYEEELKQRDAARRRVILLNLVAAVDRRLVLTEEQRDKLSDILDRNWAESWDQLQLLMQGGQYFPQMPDDKIVPILTETQRNVWRKIPKGNVHFGGTELDWLQGIDMADEVWTEPASKK